MSEIDFFRPEARTQAAESVKAVEAQTAAEVVVAVRRKTLRANVARSARAAFYDLGISRTSGRNGILVFVSTFERSCVVLPDIGIDVAALGPGWSEACELLDRAVRQGRLPDFFLALRSLGPVLGKTMPRAEDDVNELPDEVQ